MYGRAEVGCVSGVVLCEDMIGVFLLDGKMVLSIFGLRYGI